MPISKTLSKLNVHYYVHSETETVEALRLLLVGYIRIYIYPIYMDISTVIRHKV